MPISIFHVGLPLDHPSIPIEDRPELTMRLANLRQGMKADGFNYEFIHCSPEKGLDEFKHRVAEPSLAMECSLVAALLATPN